MGTGVFLEGQGDEEKNSKQAICRGATGWKQDQPEGHSKTLLGEKWPGMVTHAFNSSIQSQRQEDICEFQASLVCRASSRAEREK